MILKINFWQLNYYYKSLLDDKTYLLYVKDNKLVQLKS